MDKKNKSIFLAIMVIFIGLSVAGGTYAYLTVALNVNNAIYNSSAHCFSIDYNINNADNTQDITGTLFPSSGPSGGLSGRVGLKTNAGCSLNGSGTLILNVSSADAKLTTSGTEHCEDVMTLETLKEYKTSASCNDNGAWTSTSTPLKYAIYDNNMAMVDPLTVGFIAAGDVGTSRIILKNLKVDSVQRYYYIFVWLDGNMTDNTYTNLSFNANISAAVTQTEKGLPSEYQAVEYISSSGSQYIDTGFVANQDTSFSMKVKYKAGNFIFGSDGDTSGNVNAVGVNKSSSNTFRWHYDSNSYQDSYSYSYGNIYEIDINKNVMFVNGTKAATFTYTGFQTPSSVLISGIRRRNSIDMSSYGSSLDIYYFRIYDNGSLVRDFIPCYIIDGGTVGLYDKVTQTFYAGNVSGLVAGPNA